jgi:hypothetical protein
MKYIELQTDLQCQSVKKYPTCIFLNNRRFEICCKSDREIYLMLVNFFV